MNYKFLTGRENNELIQYNDQLLHKECIDDFKRLQTLAKNEIDADLQIVSSFREHSRQELIWNAKASGKRDLLDSKGSIVDFNQLSPTELLNSIMRWSAIPGASRHHWGTDFDIYDAKKISKKDLKLTPQESNEDGILHEFHLWLTEKIKAKNSFNFFRPYALDHGGISPEMWHISHSTLSSPLLEHYTIEVFEQNIHESNILLKENILNELESIYNLYIQTISPVST